MRVLNVCNLKGGVGKTITSTNMAYVLATLHKKRVLVIDNDKQGNTSKFFGAHGYDAPTLAEIMLVQKIAKDVIQHTQYDGIDIIPANMNLLGANKNVMLDTMNPQQTRLKKALKEVETEYDYCIIDNAPDVNMSVINALTAGDDFIIPVKVDRYTFDGVDIMLEYAQQIRESFNERLTFRGCLVTNFRYNDVNLQGIEYLKKQRKYWLLESVINWTAKVDESTFACLPVTVHSPRCGAARGYKAFANEYLHLIGDVSESNTKGEK